MLKFKSIYGENMELDDCVKNRKSCRTYKDQKVSWELIGEILDAATYAPSAGNLQNWRFVVVTDEKKKEDIAIFCLRQMWMVQAPVIIVICNERDKVLAAYPNRGELYSVQNCALAAQNIMLKAEDLGLRTCWIGAFDTRAIQRTLKLPENIIPEMILTLGYGDEPGKEFYREPIDKITYFDEWGKKKLDESILPVAQKAEVAIEETKKRGIGFWRRIFGRKP